MRRALLVAVLVLMAWPAWGDQADSWLRNCQAGAVAKNITPSAFVCFTPVTADNNDETPILDTSACTNGVDIFLFQDAVHTGAADCTVAWQPEMCPHVSTMDTNAERDFACAALPAVAAMSGDDAEVNIGVMWLRFTAGGAGANVTSCRIEVRCSDGAP